MPGFKDDDLLHANLIIEDPESLPSIVMEIPDGETASVEYAYNVRSRGRKARCVYCRHDNHFIGVVALYPSGKRCLVGKDCAAIHYGAEFAKQIASLDNQIERQAELRRRDRLLAQRWEIAKSIVAIAQDETVNKFTELRITSRRVLGRLSSALAWIANSDGVLRISEKIRDKDAEKRRADDLGLLTGRLRRKAERNGEIAPIYVEKTREFGRLRGLEFFRGGPSVADHLQEISREINKILTRISVDGISTHNLRGEFRSLRDCASGISIQLDRLPSIRDALSVENLIVLQEWASAFAETHPPDEWDKRELMNADRVSEFMSFSVAQGKLIRTDRYQSFSVGLPQNFKVPENTTLRLISEALDG